MKYSFFLIIILFAAGCNLFAQDSYKLKLDVPLYDYPENSDLPYNFPSMNQAMEWSNDIYSLGFWGVDKLGDYIFKPYTASYTGIKKFGNNFFKYALGFAFSKWGSELPIPLGIWAHEEFHRSVLGIRSVATKNGNWIFSRWDGTVYGVSDEYLSSLKLNDLRHLLYSYVAGVQYEILLNEKITLGDFYSKKAFSRGPLVLYNAYYVWNYFRFSAGSASDSAKILAPPHEDINPIGRDFTGADLNSWVYDMFSPGVSFAERDPFPNGFGVNRRIGYSDLSPPEKDYINNQKKLSLLNFLNPSIFLIDRIKLTDNFSFSFFARYAPVHFGNDIALFVPFKVRSTGYLVNIHRYSNNEFESYGAGFGLYNLKIISKIYSDFRIDLWDQPESFFESSRTKGGSLEIKTDYDFSENFSIFLQFGGKTKGWIIGHPYLDENIYVRTGFTFSLSED